MSAQVRLIDALHLGRPSVIGCWLVDDVIVDPGPTSCLDTLLEGLHGVTPRALLLTHIHLDHAGASGSLVERFPDLEVYVHEIGIPHLLDPSKLVKSATRLYGEDMDRLWGDMLPVPEANLRELQGGERVLEDRFEVAYTPGHASHHVSYFREGTAYVGDVGGVRIAGGLTVAPTPPPDIDVEAWHHSLATVAAWRPRRLAMTHFGATEDVEAQLHDLATRLDAWAQLARETDQDGFIAAIESEIAAHAPDQVFPAYIQAAPPEQLYMGLARYWAKRG